MCTSLGFQCQNYVPTSDIGSLQSGWLGVWTSDAEADVVALGLKVKIEAYDTHKCHRVGNFGVRQVPSTPTIHEKCHGHKAKPVGRR